MFGQWGHHSSDQVSSHDGVSSGNGLEARVNMTRWDWAQDLFEWFGFISKVIGPEPEQIVQIQRSDGQWRIEDRTTGPPMILIGSTSPSETVLIWVIHGLGVLQ